MRRWALVAGFVTALLAAAGSIAVWAQVSDSNPCQQSCYEQKSACVSACGTHSNPIECEQRCHDELDDCLQQCG